MCVWPGCVCMKGKLHVNNRKTQLIEPFCFIACCLLVNTKRQFARNFMTHLFRTLDSSVLSVSLNVPSSLIYQISN